jgi:succinylglutamate desuccinylase
VIAATIDGDECFTYVNFVSVGSLRHMINPERIIGKFKGASDGPLLVALGGIHGNEPAGVQAIEIVYRLLEMEPEVNSDFAFSGTFLGLRGNLRALLEGKRYIEKDMNRSLQPPDVASILQSDPATLEAEDKEIYELISLIHHEVDILDPARVVVLDLHTTSAAGGIFVLSSRDPESIRIGIEMHAPVITGFAEGVRGTTMEYFSPEQFGREVISVVFESGRHDEPLSVNRAIAGIINCMRTIGSVPAAHVENKHDYLLQEYSRDLPKVAELVDRYQIVNGADFQMIPDYNNFEQVTAGQVVAYADGKPVRAAKDGLLLMPKYQEQSQDGFFIIEPLEGY